MDINGIDAYKYYSMQDKKQMYKQIIVKSNVAIGSLNSVGELQMFIIEVSKCLCAELCIYLKRTTGIHQKETVIFFIWY